MYGGIVACVFSYTMLHDLHIQSASYLDTPREDTSAKYSTRYVTFSRIVRIAYPPLWSVLDKTRLNNTVGASRLNFSGNLQTEKHVHNNKTGNVQRVTHKHTLLVALNPCTFSITRWR